MDKEETDDHILVIDQLKMSYDRQWDLKVNLENKAMDAIKIGALIITVLFGFLNLPDSKIDLIGKIIIFPGIVAILISIIIAMIAVRLSPHPYVITESEMIDKLLEKSSPERLTDLICEYRKGIVLLSDKNLVKSEKVKYVQYSMVVGIICLMVALIYVVIIQ